jgi:hypothetical protein
MGERIRTLGNASRAAIGPFADHGFPYRMGKIEDMGDLAEPFLGLEAGVFGSCFLAAYQAIEEASVAKAVDGDHRGCL